MKRYTYPVICLILLFAFGVLVGSWIGLARAEEKPSGSGDTDCTDCFSISATALPDLSPSITLDSSLFVSDMNPNTDDFALWFSDHLWTAFEPMKKGETIYLKLGDHCLAKLIKGDDGNGTMSKCGDAS